MAKRLHPDAMKALVARISEKKVAKVGFFEDAQYPDGTPVAYIAAIQEFGYPEGNIPPRSFIRTTISEKKADWNALMVKGARAIIRGKQSVESVMEGMGLQAEGDMRKKITEINDPPLKEATLAARRRRGNSSAKPLNDTGYMLSQLVSQVESE